MIHFKLKNVSIRHKGILAPMLDYTHLPFRLLCDKYKAGLTFSEMISIHQIINFKDDLSKLDSLYSTNLEGRTAVQLFGDFSDSRKTLEAVYLLDKYKYFDIIDLNLGCPSLKILNSNSGSFNLKQINKIIPTITTAVNTTLKPITIKTRLGFSENKIESISSKLLKTGVSALSIHGRLAKENYSTPSNVFEIRKIKQNSSVPIIYNGDVNSNNFKDYLDFDGIMVGREALGNPFIFKQIDTFVNDHKLITKDDSYTELIDFLEFVKKYPISFSKLKISLIPFFKDRVGSSKIRTNISLSKSYEELIKIVNTQLEQ